MSQHQVSPVQRCGYQHIYTGISRLEIKKKTRSTKSRITEEDREIILSVLFNDPNIFACQKHLESEVTGKVSFTEEFDIPINKFQTSSKDTERYGHQM